MVICFRYLHSFQNYSIFRSFFLPTKRNEDRNYVLMWVMIAAVPEDRHMLKESLKSITDYETCQLDV